MPRPKGPTATAAWREFVEARDRWYGRAEGTRSEFDAACEALNRWDEEHGHVSPDGLTNLPDLAEYHVTFFEWAEWIKLLEERGTITYPPAEVHVVPTPIVKIEPPRPPTTSTCRKCQARHRWWADTAAEFGDPHEFTVEEGVGHWRGKTGLLCASRDSSGLT